MKISKGLKRPYRAYALIGNHLSSPPWGTTENFPIYWVIIRRQGLLILTRLDHYPFGYAILVVFKIGAAKSRGGS